MPEINKRSAKYWAGRFEQLENAQNNKGVEYFHDLERIYQKAISETEKNIAKWYNRYAREEGITLAETKKQLTKNELKEFRMSLQEYIEKGESLDPKWARQLERASTKFHITRLEALKLQMQQNVEYLMGNEADGVDKLMRDIFTDSYYHSAFEIQKGIGIGWDLMKLDKNVIDKAMSKPWTADGTNFSERIWGKYRPELVKKLHDGLTINLIQGKSADKLIDDIKKQFNVSRHRAENLVMTEKAYFQSLGQMDAFKSMNVKEYEIVATLDSKTSEICQHMDGKVFKINDYAPGATAPPFHNRCRTATAPFFDDEFTVDEERASRDEEGKYKTVPSDMKYKDWHKAFVEGDKSVLDQFTNGKVDYATQLKELENKFSEMTEGYSYDDFIDEFGTIENGFEGAEPDEIKEAKELAEKIEELRKKVYNESVEEVVKEENFDIIGNTTKLKHAMKEEDYEEYLNILNNHENSSIKKIYADYADGIDDIVYKKNSGGYRLGSIEFDYEHGMKYEEIHKFSTLAHEYGHYFDAKAKFNVHFKEVDKLNNAIKSANPNKSYLHYFFDNVASSSDEFLEAVRKDKEYLKIILTDELKDELRKHHGSSGVQDAIEGMLDITIRWGHGSSYYNRRYNRAKSFKIHNILKDSYKELGFNISKLNDVKDIVRNYETASEMWANIMSAVVCGGKELEYTQKYLPNSYEALLKILEGVE